MLGVMALVLHLLQPYFVSRFAALFTCIQMGKDPTDNFLSLDPEIQCWLSSEHRGYIAALGIPLFFYVVGIPLAVFFCSESYKNFEFTLS